jgi:superoxide dismutase, Cu-Zn family
MKNPSSIALLFVVAGLAGVLNAPGEAGAGAQATAEIVDTEGKAVGTADFMTTDKGVQVKVHLHGLKAAANSNHGLHIHQFGKCKPTFDAAGDHFNPFTHHHGYLGADGPHAGDMPNIWVETNGTARYTYTTNLFTLDEGERAILDEDGAAIIIHAQADDYLTGTSGSAGDPIACGVITSTAE